MPQLEEAIYSRLSTFAGLTALVAQRIYPIRAPEAVPMPLVVYQRISSYRWSAMKVDTGVARARMQVTAWATQATTAKSVKEQVRKALERWSGTVAGMVILDSYIADERDLFEETSQEAGQGETGAYGVSLDAMIPYRET